MIKVGFITTPLVSADSARGIGFYTKRLLEAMKTQAPAMQMSIFEDKLEDVDIIHYPFFSLAFHTLPVFRSAKSVVTIHDVIPLEFSKHYPLGIKGNINLALQKLALRSVDAVITDSYASVKAIRKYLNAPHHKIKLIYLAADSKFKPVHDIKILERVRKKYDLPKKFVLYVGSINWNKNLPGLVQACRQINYPLVITGKHAAEIETLDLSHAELEHLKDIDWSEVCRVGYVSDDDLVAIYNLATVYCQPSFAEGFGLPVLEALACGTPVACSSTHSLPEIAGDVASYFDPYNISSIARALQEVRKNTRLAIQQAEKFSWDKTACDTLNLYKEVYET